MTGFEDILPGKTQIYNRVKADSVYSVIYLLQIIISELQRQCRSKANPV